MENNTDSKVLTEQRDTGGCVKAGYGLYAAVFTKMFKASWMAAAVYSLIFAALGTVCVTQLPRIAAAILGVAPAGEAELRTTAALLGILVITGGIAEILFYSCGMSLLREHKGNGGTVSPRRWFSADVHTAWRTLKICVPLCIVSCVVFTALGFVLTDETLRASLPYWAVAAVPAVIYIAVGILLLPSVVSIMKYVLDDNAGIAKSVRYGYSSGIARLPLILAVVFISACITALLGLVLSLPALILMTANWMAYFGTAAGDPLGMPEYMTALTAVTFALTGFMQTYVRMPLVFTTYYIYGQTETGLKTGQKEKTE